MCLRGSSEVETNLFEHEPSAKLRGYAVWVPKLLASESHVGPATATARDPRIGHFWDAKGIELTAFRPPLQLASDAWDVYLIYPPGVRWDGSTPPAPAFWMHQLGDLVPASVPRLDGTAFAARARALLLN
jgi:hypothetical protein